MTRSEIALLVLAVIFGAWWRWDRRERKRWEKRIQQPRPSRRKDEN